MFKKILASSLLLISFVGCNTFGTVKITKDSFKDAHIVNLKLRLKSTEPVLGAPFDSALTKYFAEMDFTREIGKEKIVPTAVRFKILASPQNTLIERSGFLKIGEKSTPLAFGNVSAQVVTEVTTTTTNTPSNSNTSFGSGKLNTKVDTNVRKELTGTFLLKKEDEEAILKANDFVVRFYSGSEPITIPVTEDDLAKFKEYLNAKPEAGN
ncbi:hypothetical protein ACQV5M_07190 [Leptospira sp. SA-E8]|uniref:hypothetical protein n=1 Tax=Leptospira sp. SA-E8 TaxID=3422259 RepID=UPI003EBC46A9